MFASKDEVDSEDTGLETFAFMRTPANSFGNTVWIQGGNSRSEGSNGVGGWWQRLGGSGGSGLGSAPMRARTLSQESLRSAGRHEMAIQMDVVTSVAVEVEPNKERDPRYPDPSMSNNPSLSSGEKEYMRTFGA